MFTSLLAGAALGYGTTALAVSAGRGLALAALHGMHGSPRKALASLGAGVIAPWAALAAEANLLGEDLAEVCATSFRAGKTAIQSWLPKRQETEPAASTTVDSTATEPAQPPLAQPA